MFIVVDDSYNPLVLRTEKDLLEYMENHGFYATLDEDTKLSKKDIISTLKSEGYAYLHPVSGDCSDFTEKVTYIKA